LSGLSGGWGGVDFYLFGTTTTIEQQHE